MASISMIPLFHQCIEILEERLDLIPSAKLAEMAVRRITGKPELPKDFFRLKEDVREKMQKSRRETFYVGRPLCCYGLKRWFALRSELLVNGDYIEIPVTEELIKAAKHEIKMRGPYMKIKTAANKKRVMDARLRGMVIEKHVAAYFQNRYRLNWEPPDNEGIWHRGCGHDFKIRAAKKTIRIDVAGPRWDDKYGQPKGFNKPTDTDAHILASLEKNAVVIHGADARLTLQGIHEVNSWPIGNFIVWLNLQVAGEDWQAVREKAIA